MNTYEILQEYKALDSLLNEINEETGEYINSKEDIQEYINSLENDRDTKLINIEKLKREKQGTINTIDLEIKRLQGLKKQLNNNVNSLIDLQMILTQGQKLDLGLYRFSTRKSKSVQITNENLIDDEYYIIKKEVSKSKISEAIKKGIEVSGVEMIEKISLTVK